MAAFEEASMRYCPSNEMQTLLLICPVEQIIIDKLLAMKRPEMTLTNWVCSKWGKVFPVDGAPYSKSKP